MKIRLDCLIFAFLTFICCRLSSDDLISPLLQVNTNSKNAGIFMRFMPTGIAYLREIGMKTVNNEILRIKLPLVTERVDAGQVTIYNAYVSKYWSPPEYNLELAPPDMFTWSMSKMHIRAAGDFEVSAHNPLLLPTVPIRGQFETLFGHISLAIAIRLGRSEDGAPRVRSTYCQADVGYVDLNVTNTGVITDFFINSFKAFIIANFKPVVQERICKMIKSVVNNNMNQILSTMPLQVHLHENTIDIIGETFGLSEKKPLSRYGDLGARNITLTNIIHNLRKQNLILDYRLIKDPLIAYGSIGMYIKGEISWNGYGGTPFDPPNVEIPPPHGIHMVEFFGTDYLANSMLYHAFRQKYMDLKIGPESSNRLENLLFTSCKVGFCVGEQLGLLSEQFPDREIEIHFFARKSPILVFVEKRARFRLYGGMDMYVRPANSSQVKIKILKCDATLTSTMYLQIDEFRVTGNASVETLDFKLRETIIKDVTQETLNDLSLFAAEFLQNILTEILKIGIMMPKMKGVMLKNPRLSLHERYLKVQTLFKLDERFTGRILEGAVRESLKNFRSS